MELDVYHLTFIILFDYGWSDTACDKIKYLISEKSSIADSIN